MWKPFWPHLPRPTAAKKGSGITMVRNVTSPKRLPWQTATRSRILRDAASTPGPVTELWRKLQRDGGWRFRRKLRNQCKGGSHVRPRPYVYLHLCASRSRLLLLCRVVKNPGDLAVLSARRGRRSRRDPPEVCKSRLGHGLAAPL